MNTIYLLVKNNIGTKSTMPQSMVSAVAYIPSVAQIRTLLNELIDATNLDDEVICETMHLMGKLATQHQFTLKSWRTSLIACFYLSAKAECEKGGEVSLDTAVCSVTRIPIANLHKMEADILQVLDYHPDCEQDSEF
ncbi:Cyclin N-terminal domain-containing protein [Spironucleus salmonicida]|uniref:Cyclin N-terminal domain-containing protein n=1 Tax=Spironucleus salmonicida TaxID=348837 RepID=V6M4A7_9EUKA|nr:Cyclin N-terminal domain-containing protein [Spironucleus salmonicida]KAH0577232.1 Cyclin N-terminal domain-containing protein [Spironucleus salmonicida]KAH0577241.1 Cyclin N-terminal domain-containing protein [Spironucleus salmonicida]|eukprot:EST45863.1 Cyclin, N-terminal domain-containing protein [Spironucleus salmonicida]